MAAFLPASLSASLGKRLLPITLSQIVGLLCGIVGVKLSSHLIAPDDYGRYGVFLTFTPLGMWVVHVGLLKFTTRFWAHPGDQRARWHTITQQVLQKMPWLMSAALLTAAISSPSRWGALAGFIFVSAGLLSFGALAQAALQADKRHWSDFTVSITGSTSRTLWPLLLYWLTGGASIALYAGFTLHALCFAGAGVWILRRQLTTAPSAIPDVMPTAYTGALFTILAVVAWSLIGLNRWLVAAFFGAASAGQFTLATNIAVIIPSMLGMILTQYFQPDFFAAPHTTDADRRTLANKVDRVATFYAISALVVGALLAWSLPWLIGTLIDARYTSAVAFVFPASCYTVALTTGHFYQQLLLACHRESACARVDLACAALMIMGGLITAACGQAVFMGWLLATPGIPWILNRPLSRWIVLASPDKES